MFEKPPMPNVEGEDNEKGYEIKKKSEKKEGKIKTDYDVRIETPEPIEHKSQKWEELDTDLQKGIIEAVGDDEFTVKFISITRVMDEAGIFDAAGSIELIDKEGKKLAFHVEHHYSYDTKQWKWVISDEKEYLEEMEKHRVK